MSAEQRLQKQDRQLRSRVVSAARERIACGWYAAHEPELLELAVVPLHNALLAVVVDAPHEAPPDTNCHWCCSPYGPFYRCGSCLGWFCPTCMETHPCGEDGPDDDVLAGDEQARRDEDDERFDADFGVLNH